MFDVFVLWFVFMQNHNYGIKNGDLEEAVLAIWKGFFRDRYIELPQANYVE